MKRVFFLICVCLFDVESSIAASISSPEDKITTIGKIGAPVTTLTAEPLEAKTWSFGQRYEYYKLRSFSDPDLIHLTRENRRSVESNDYYSAFYFAAAYGLTENLSLGTVLPFIRLANIRTGDFSSMGNIKVDALGTSEGVGDETLLGLWRFYNDKKNDISSLITFGTDMPIGDTKEKDQFGNVFSATDQPGDGAWNPFLGFAYTQKWGKKYSYSASILYIKGRRGTQDVNLGDGWSYNMAGVRHFHIDSPFLDLDAILELNGERYQKANIAGLEIDPNTGGRTLYLSPALRLTTKGGFSPYVSFNVPLIQEWNGVQSYNKYVFIAGFDFQLMPKKEEKQKTA
jgi:hypothetical protein